MNRIKMGDFDFYMTYLLNVRTVTDHGIDTLLVLSSAATEVSKPVIWLPQTPANKNSRFFIFNSVADELILSKDAR